MKVITVILALFVVALSVLPCCMTDNCTGGEVMTEQSDSHDADACSPFYSCSACPGFTVSGFTIGQASPILYSNSLFADYRQSLYTQFHHSIWQPPK
ncbi:hypothetical protein GCM10023188_14500 [Pontibacter saemangeumensis]|uniref:Uncharacterized protein n=1 Tax=Pontibacter saemangeumensis TaxID=1084525 RepID=A0ABP8LHB7_9BACT